MAKFNDSGARDGAHVVSDTQPTDVADRSIGSIIAETRNLTADQVEKVLAHQKARASASAKPPLHWAMQHRRRAVCAEPAVPLPLCR